MPSLMFPELAALAYGIFKAPYGPWAKAPAMSAGLFPLTFGIRSTLYAPSLLLGLDALALVQATGWRFLLFPPLVVIAFEMFAHVQVCPWL
jgi:hypothetical protein